MAAAYLNGPAFEGPRLGAAVEALDEVVAKGHTGIAGSSVDLADDDLCWKGTR